MEKWKEIYRSKELEKEMKKERREQKKEGIAAWHRRWRSGRRCARTQRRKFGGGDGR
jgi:hypothetical protein